MSDKMTDKTPDDTVIEQAARVALDAMEAKQRTDKEAVRAALGDLAVDLDSKEHDYRVEAWEVARALADAGLLHTAQDDLDLGDAERIKAERDELRATVERVRALHVEHECTGYPDCQIFFGGECALDGHCNHCRRSWPCPTLRALDGAGERQ